MAIRRRKRIKTVNENIAFNVPFVPDVSRDYVLSSLNSRHLSGDGPFTKQVEKGISSISAGSTAILVTSCTHALELACQSLNLKQGDEVILPSYNFTSAAIAVLSAGGTPVFADIHANTKNLNEELLSDCLTVKTRAIVPVHYAGVGAEMNAIMAFANENELAVIEDNAHGLGGSFKGKKLGSFGSMSTLSFHETKNIQCGEGGAIEVNDESLVERLEIMREKGTDRSKFFRGQVAKYQWTDIGSSWLPSDILAALLLGQVEMFDSIQESRHHTWNSYNDALSKWASDEGFELPFIPDGEVHTAHMFYMVSPSLEVRTRFISHMSNLGISTPFHYQSLHSSKAGKVYGRSATTMEVSDRMSDCLVRLPLWVGLSDAQISRVITAVLDFKS